MYVVRVKIAIKEEKEWSRWHDEVHIPRVLAQPGFIQVRKFRCISSSTIEAEYFVLYELRNRAAYNQYVKSEEGAKLRQEYLDAYGGKTKITRWAWEESFHLVK
jgi:heme-degrading monooxygenase HmoA